ncbi:hypothetical protein ACFX2B_025229 [Malus domestica]
MEVWKEELEPVSLINAHYFNNSVLSVSVLGVLECEIPIDDSQTLSLLEKCSCPSTLSSIMVVEDMLLSLESNRRGESGGGGGFIDGGKRLGAEEEEEEGVGGERVLG